MTILLKYMRTNFASLSCQSNQHWEPHKDLSPFQNKNARGSSGMPTPFPSSLLFLSRNFKLIHGDIVQLHPPPPTPHPRLAPPCPFPAVVAWVCLIVLAFGFPYSARYQAPGAIWAFSAVPWTLLAKGIQDLALAAEGVCVGGGGGGGAG